MCWRSGAQSPGAGRTGSATRRTGKATPGVAGACSWRITESVPGATSPRGDGRACSSRSGQRPAGGRASSSLSAIRLSRTARPASAASPAGRHGRSDRPATGVTETMPAATAWKSVPCRPPRTSPARRSSRSGRRAAELAHHRLAGMAPAQLVTWRGRSAASGRAGTLTLSSQAPAEGGRAAPRR